VYRQATISLAGLAIDPASFLFSVVTFARQRGQPASDKRVCSSSIEQFRSTPVHKSGGTNGSRRAGNLK